MLCYDVIFSDVSRRALTAGLVETALRCVLAKMAASATFKMAIVTVRQVLYIAGVNPTITMSKKVFRVFCFVFLF